MALTFEEKCDALSILNPHALVADGLDDAFIGIVRKKGQDIALYDTELCLEILMQEHDMDDEEALDYFGYNVVSAYMGPGTPAFTYIYPETSDEEHWVSRADGTFVPELVIYFDEEDFNAKANS